MGATTAARTASEAVKTNDVHNRPETVWVSALTPRQRLFVATYLANGGSATAAAKSVGYSERSAHSCGPRLMEHAGVKAAIEAGLKKREQRAILDADRCDQAVARLAYTEPSEDVPASAIVSANQLAYKRLGLLKDRVEHEVGPSLAELLAEARRRSSAAGAR